MNTWTFDSVKIYLTNPDGNEVILTSNDISDYTMDEIIDDINSYVNEKGGELEWKWTYILNIGIKKLKMVL